MFRVVKKLVKYWWFFALHRKKRNNRSVLNGETCKLISRWKISLWMDYLLLSENYYFREFYFVYCDEIRGNFCDFFRRNKDQVHEWNNIKIHDLYFKWLGSHTMCFINELCPINIDPFCIVVVNCDESQMITEVKFLEKKQKCIFLEQKSLFAYFQYISKKKEIVQRISFRHCCY